MSTTLVIEEQLEIPLNLHSLADFRRWATSDDFPERGRIDYLAGRIEQFSTVLGCDFRLECRRDAQGHQTYDLRQS